MYADSLLPAVYHPTLRSGKKPLLQPIRDLRGVGGEYTDEDGGMARQHDQAVAKLDPTSNSRARAIRR